MAYLGSTRINIGTTEVTSLVTSTNPLPSLLSDGTHFANVHPIDSQIHGDEYGVVTNAVIHGKSTAGGGTFVDVKVSPSGAVQVGGDVGITGTVAVTDNGGSLTVDGSVTVTQSTATNLKTQAEMYRGGTVVSGSNPVPVSLPAANQSAFGTLETAELTPVFQTDFVYGLNTQLWTTAGTSGTGATVDTNTRRLRVQSGTSSTAYAYITSRRIIKYRAGQGVTARFTTAFTTGAAGNLQGVGCGSIVSNAPYDGYFVGYSGTSFGVFHYLAGTPAFTARASFNGDTIDGNGASGFNLDPTFGNVWMIKYPYLGYGDINFFVLNSATGAWILAHTIRYANTTATTQLTNPNLQFLAFTTNSGNTTNKIVYCASVGVFVSGIRSNISQPKWAVDNSKSSITTETNLLTLKNATTYNGVTNRSLIRLQSIGIAVTAAAASVVTIRFKINATLGGSPSYTTINGTTADAGVTITSGNSITSYDVAGTTVASGTYIWNTNSSAGQNGSGGGFIDLQEFNLFVAPGETLTISGASPNNATIGVALNWTEDI